MTGLSVNTWRPVALNIHRTARISRAGGDSTTAPIADARRQTSFMTAPAEFFLGLRLGLTECSIRPPPANEVHFASLLAPRPIAEVDWAIAFWTPWTHSRESDLSPWRMLLRIPIQRPHLDPPGGNCTMVRPNWSTVLATQLVPLPCLAWLQTRQRQVFHAGNRGEEPMAGAVEPKARLSQFATRRCAQVQCGGPFKPDSRSQAGRGCVVSGGPRWTPPASPLPDC